METEMSFVGKLAGAALVTLLLMPGATIALERTVQIVGHIDTPVIINVEPRERLSPEEMGFGDNNSGGDWGGIFDRPNPKIDGPIIHINGTQIEVPGTIYPKTKTYVPTLNFGGTGQGAQADQTRPLELAVACKVAGTPRALPDDLVLINHGATLNSGTTIKWKIKSAGQGYIQLNRDLPTGGTIKASGVLDGGVEAGKPCTASII
jgi:hypothetical protein